MTEPVTVTFSIEVGDIWVDSAKVQWRIARVEGVTVHLERVNTRLVGTLDLVRDYRKKAS